MKKTLAFVMAVAFVAAFAAPMLAAETTIKGEVIDVKCYNQDHSQVGKDHEQCALSCARRGNQMGILTSDGVYLIAGDYSKENNKKLIEFVAKQVQAKGEVTEKDGQKTITVAAMTLAKGM
jgi:hypothetical protein